MKRLLASLVIGIGVVAVALTMRARAAKSIAACYSVDFAGWEGPGFNGTIKIDHAGSGHYTLEFVVPASENKSGKRIPPMQLKDATAEEVAAVGKAFGFHAVDGVSWKGDASNTPNYKPVGLYRGTNNKGEPMAFAYFFMTNGLATRVDCR